MSQKSSNPLLIGFCNDLMFTSRIESVAMRLNYRMRWIETSDEFEYDKEIDLPPRQYAEHLVGPGAMLIDQVTTWQPALIIVDINNPDIPWRKWTALLKSAPATRRIPVLCFGSHMDVQAMKAAKEAGADVVLARSRFVTKLPELIEKYAHLPDYNEFESACQDKLTPLAIQGLELFNMGEYFEAHELLEDAWNEDVTVGRELYRAILQVAVAYLQIERRNYKGAVKMFLRVRQWIEPLPDECRGVDVARLRQDAGRVERRLLELGSEGIAAFDHHLFQPVHYIS